MGTQWSDRVSVLVSSLILIGVSVLFISRNGFETITESGQNLTWYLVRGSGMTAYILMTLSTLFGIVISSRTMKDWSPAPVSMVVHTTVAYLSIIFTLIHMLLLLFDKYFTYTLADLFVPFQGPYRPFPVGLGTVSFWIMVIVALSYPIRKRLGHKNWRFMHYVSYLAYIMTTAHAYLAGTDAKRLGFQAVLLISVSLTFVFLGYRMGIKGSTASAKEQRKPAPVRAAKPVPVPTTIPATAVPALAHDENFAMSSGD